MLYSRRQPIKGVDFFFTFCVQVCRNWWRVEDGDSVFVAADRWCIYSRSYCTILARFDLFFALFRQNRKFSMNRA
ncbi:hypothetical protein L596_009828 [Steinernema carpocapsae]|uniref:Uncharacterized protein n=1 Tax=Steinernema carpocapsae TaxID=34508 RepID=A0A4U5PH03_STECR|nr:hypothetical protein L596_009828 [Steinernema carpocapsae]